MDDDLSHKVEEAFDIWRHVWPIAKVLVPLSVTLFVAAYGVGVIAIPFAKQRQVDEMWNDQRRQDDAVKDLKSGMTEVHG
jgi:hypothetical protein